MSALTLLRGLFRYQAWANDELLQKIASIDSEPHWQERRVAIRLLNHCYVVDRIFAAHLVGATHNFSEDNTVDTPEIEALRAAVATSDRWYLEYLETTTPDLLSEVPAIRLYGRRQGMHVARGNADPCRHAWRLSPRRSRAHLDPALHQAAMGYFRRLSSRNGACAPTADFQIKRPGCERCLTSL